MFTIHLKLFPTMFLILNINIYIYISFITLCSLITSIRHKRLFLETNSHSIYSSKIKLQNESHVHFRSLKANVSKYCEIMGLF